MNRAFTYILVGGASALVGAISGYALCKHDLEKHYENLFELRVNEEIARLRKVNETIHKTDNEPKEEKVDDQNPIFETTLDEPLSVNRYRAKIASTKTAEWQRQGLSDDEINQNLEKLYAEMEYPEEEDDEESPYLETEEDEEPQNTMSWWAEQPVTLLSEQEYVSLPPHFVFVTFRYFSGDDVLVDDEDMVVENVEETVGEALNHFGDPAYQYDDDDTVYVVNGSMGIAIEIARSEGSYTEWSGMR